MILLALTFIVGVSNPELAKRLRLYLTPRRIATVLASIGMMVSILTSLGCSSLTPWQKANSFNAQQAKRWTNGGLDAFQKGRFSHAQSCFTRAMDHDPNDPQIQAHLAATLVQKGDLPTAIAHLEKSVQRSGNSNPMNNVRLGELYLANGQWIPARRQAEIALNSDRHLPAAWILKGNTEYAKGSWTDALADFQRALGYQPKNSEVHLHIAETYQKMNQPMRALATVEKLLSHFPADQQPEKVLIAKCDALMNLEHYQSAINVLQVATQKADASVDVFVQLGKAQLLAGQTSQARMTLNRAKILFPNEPEIDILVAKLQTDNRDVALVTFN